MNESTAEQAMWAALAEICSVPLTPEEKEVLDGFEAFQREHPISFASLQPSSPRLPTETDP
jgi:hypothetical protein